MKSGQKLILIYICIKGLSHWIAFNDVPCEKLFKTNFKYTRFKFDAEKYNSLIGNKLQLIFKKDGKYIGQTLLYILFYNSYYIIIHIIKTKNWIYKITHCFILN